MPSCMVLSIVQIQTVVWKAERQVYNYCGYSRASEDCKSKQANQWGMCENSNYLSVLMCDNYAVRLTISSTLSWMRKTVNRAIQVPVWFFPAGKEETEDKSNNADPPALTTYLRIVKPIVCLVFDWKRHGTLPYAFLIFIYLLHIHYIFIYIQAYVASPHFIPATTA